MNRITLRALTLINIATFCVVLTAAFPLPVPRLVGATAPAREVPAARRSAVPGEGLRARLRSPNALVRTLAASEAGRAGALDVVPDLRRLVAEDESMCAGAAGVALDALGDGCGALLARAMRTREPEAVIALAQCRDAAARPALLLLLESPDEPVAAAALRALAIEPGRRARQAIAAALRGPDGPLRMHALEAALDAGVPWPRRTAPGFDGSGAARDLADAIRARGGDDEASSRLVSRVAHPGADGRRALRLLVRSGRPETADLVEQRLFDATPIDAASLLADLRGATPRSLVPSIRPALRHPDRRVRVRAALLLGDLGVRAAVPALERDGLTSDDAVVRADARCVLAGLLR